MVTKTYVVKESGFVSVYINARTKSEAIRSYKMKYGWYGGSISVRENDKKLKLYPKKNKYPTTNLMLRYNKK